MKIYKSIHFLVIFSFVLMTQVSFAEDGSQAAPASNWFQNALSSAGKFLGIGEGDGATAAVQDKALGLSEVKGEIQTLNARLNMMGSKGEILNYEPFLAAQKNYEASWNTCVQNQNTAETWCLEQFSPDIKNGAAGIAAILSGVSMQASTADSCSKIGNAANIAKTAFAGFATNCGIQKKRCDSACGAAKAALAKMQTSASQIRVQFVTAGSEAPEINSDRMSRFDAWKTAMTTELAKELKPDDKKSIAGKAKTCASYVAVLSAGAAGLLSALNSAKAAGKCNENTSASAAMNLGAELDCSRPENAEKVDCICKNNPRSPGCLLSIAGTNSTSTFGSPNSVTSTPGAGDARKPEVSLGGTGDPGVAQGVAGSSGGGGLPGAPSGGGGGLGGGSGFGGEGGGYGRGDGVIKKINTNIYSGENGGGGWSGSGGGGSRNIAGNSQLKAYLPGGSKDPTLGAIATKEVSSPAGRSNWEKVTQRYKDNKPSLLGE